MPNVTTKIVSGNSIKNGSTIVSSNQFGTRQGLAGEIENNAVTNINAVLGDKAITTLSPAPTQFYFRVLKSDSNAAPGYVNIGASGQGIAFSDGDITLSVFPFYPNDSQSIAGLEDIFDIGGYLFIQSKSRPGVYAMFNTDAIGASVSGGVMSITGTYNTGNGIFNDNEIVMVSFDAAGSGGGGGNPFNQDLNTGDSPTFVNVELQTIKNVFGTTILEFDVEGSFNLLANDGTTSVFRTNISADPIIAGLTYPKADGSATQILRTDGAGNLSFIGHNPFDQELNVDDAPNFHGLVIQDAGNNPGFTLTVSGGIAIGLAGVQGTAGQVLSSNGENAPVSWIDIPNPFDQTLNIGDGVSFGDVGAASINGQGFPASPGTDGQVLATDGTNFEWADAALLPTGTDGNVVFLDSGSLYAADDSFNYNVLTGTLSVGSLIVGTSMTVGNIAFPISLGGGGTVLGSDGFGLTFVDANPFDQELNIADAAIFGGLTLGALIYPIVDGTAGHAIITDGIGNLALSAVSDVADGTYVLGLGATTDGTITFVNGRITAIQECT